MTDPSTPVELARDLAVDPKRVRAWLRRNLPRHSVEHGQPWQLDADAVAAVRAGLAGDVGLAGASVADDAGTPAGLDARTLTVGQILSAYSVLLRELRRRGLVRTNNAPIGDLAEYACAAYYDGDLAPNSEKSHDLLAADGRRIQVKIRNLHADTRPTASFSSFRSLDFDICVLLLVDPVSNVIVAATEWTPEEVVAHGRYTAHTNSTLVRISKVLSHVAGVDVTPELRVVWSTMLDLVS